MNVRLVLNKDGRLEWRYVGTQQAQDIAAPEAAAIALMDIADSLKEIAQSLKTLEAKQ